MLTHGIPLVLVDDNRYHLAAGIIVPKVLFRHRGRSQTRHIVSLDALRACAKKGSHGSGFFSKMMVEKEAKGGFSLD